MRHKISREHENIFYIISNMCGIITEETGGSELGGAYDLARLIQLQINNVLGQNEDDDGSMIWKIGD